MDFLVGFLQSGFSAIGPFFILLGLLIFVHELGHFLVARWNGVRVEVFSLGFGKKIFQYKKGDTNYCISIMPLGGYVKMFGDDPSVEIPDNEKPYSFLHQSVGARIAIVLAGPLMNLFFAIFLFFALGLIGEQVAGTKLGDIDSNTAAYTAGFRSGDNILQINDKTMATWVQVSDTISDSAGKPLSFVLDRKNEAVTVVATPVLTPTNSLLALRSEVGDIEGLSVLSQSSRVSVLDPLSPAARAGMMPVEQISSINGVEVKTYRDIDTQLERWLRGPRGPIEIETQEITQGDSHSKRKIVVPDFEPMSPDQLSQQLGFETTSLVIFRPKSGSPAESAGLQHGDRLVMANGKLLSDFSDLVKVVSSFDESHPPIELKVQRREGIKTLSVAPELTDAPGRQGALERRYTLGIMSSVEYTVSSKAINRYGFVDSVKLGFVKTWEWTQRITLGIAKLVQNEVSSKNIGGFITIGRVASQSFEMGIDRFIQTMALISINLFLLNLLPVPVLDGGHLLFFTIEALRGAPMSMRKMEIAQQVGLVLLLFLMIFALFNDISNYFNSIW